MKKPLLKAFLILELLLFLVTIVLYLNTRNKHDFSGLIILVPIAGMALVGTVAFIVLLFQMFGPHDEAQTMKSKLLQFGAFCIFSIPLYVAFNGAVADRSLYVYSLQVFLAGVTLYIFINDKLGSWKKFYEILLLLYAPFLSILYALDPGTRTLPLFWIMLSFVIFGIGLARILRKP